MIFKTTLFAGPHTLAALLCFSSMALPAQRPPASAAEFEKNYQRRIQEEYLDGVYIPRDLEDAFITLNGLIDAESKDKFKSAAEEEAARKLHFSFGRWMIVNWGFYEGSRLSHYIRTNLEIYHPDDMARFIIILYHRNLNRRSLNVKELVTQFHEKQDRERQEFLERGTIIHEETRKRPTPSKNGGSLH